jgi:hypothetical protein
MLQLEKIGAELKFEAHLDEFFYCLVDKYTWQGEMDFVGILSPLP